MAKEKQTRRMIAMALAAAVTMSSVPVVAFADEGGEGGEATGTVTVTVTATSTATTTTTQTDISTNDTSDDGNTTTEYEGHKTETKVEVTDENSPAASEPTETPTSAEKIDTSFNNTLADDEISKSQKTDETTTTVEKTDEGTTTTVENKQTENSINADGTGVDSEVTSTTVTKTDADGNWIETNSVETGETTEVKENTENVPDVTVQLEAGKTTSNSSKPSDVVVKDGPDTDDSDGEWDYTETTETTGREVKVTMSQLVTYKGDGDVQVSDKIDTNVEAINPEWNENKDQVKAPTTFEKYDSLEELQEALKNKPDGYDFLYTGHGEDSLYGADWKLLVNGKFPGYYGYGCGTSQFQMTDLSDPSVLDMEGVTDENLKDKLDIHTAYCADVDTYSKAGYWYTIENLEDADYYKTQDAEDHIRAIALNGYWGSVGTQKDANGETVYKTDANGNVITDNDGNPVPVPETGSLDAVKAMLKDAQAQGKLSADFDVDSLTEGEALTATQMAIWKYGNPYEDIELAASTVDFNDPYWHYSTEELKSQGVDVTAAKGRINAMYAYLIGLSQTAEEAGATEIITEEKIVEVDSMSMTVGEKAEGYEANNDDNDDNDVYNVSLNFALVVEPNKDKDDLVVKVVRMVNDGQGNITTEEVAKARLSGDDKYDKDKGFSSVAYDEATGSYTLSGLELAENANCEFSLKLEGAQYLEQGVYIYSSEIRNNTPSQTFVGIAEGYKTVDVGMKVDLAFNVEEGTITETRSWRSTSSSHKDPVNSGGNDPEPTPDPEKPTPDPKDPEDPEEPGMIIEDEDVPLADAPVEDDGMVLGAEDEEEPMVLGEEEELIAATGDSNHMTAGFGGMLAALAGMFMLRRKKEN